MAVKREEKKRAAPPPAKTVEGREGQLANLAVDLAEKQMREGTASAQVITHFLKLASTREGLEQEKLRGENAVLLAKVESMASGKRIEELYDKAIKAMRVYTGAEPEEDDDEGFD